MNDRDDAIPDHGYVHGRGATVSPAARYESARTEAVDDGWHREEESAPLHTEVTMEQARSVISRNDSPDVPFELSINPYRGCEHGCVYCFARPTHAYMGLSPGLDFETRLFAKAGAADRLREALARPGYACRPIALGVNTDAYQPVERRLRITRQVLEVLYDAHHPVTIVTKSALIERDLDLLAPMARDGLAQVAVSVTTLDRTLARRLEPRAAAPQRRIETIGRLNDAGVPVSLLMAPLIPVLTDGEMESLLTEGARAGAVAAGYVLLRLPLEVAPLFEDWLRTHVPLKADHVLARIRDSRGGKLYDARFGRRMTGDGPYAELLRQRFRLARRRAGLAGRMPELDMGRFVPPRPFSGGGQMGLF
ncbi:radical SAM protein [Thioalkalivibrio denitrificans]|uniref:Radical SAM protein n=1 Tax=Thioalkalivibrio denitrificans TaxID=108003 RepID=A0A1V3NDW1_9GAMM|nr:PA0069 family radical SAM protein [Thioalkalivibrio denitrificans]OOG23289.1 radical SAM protein [Thioalkalivibrio denitrificans]